MNSGDFLKHSIGIREQAALSTIEQILNIRLLRQYRVGKYKIDGYCKETNTVYEIDESQHYVNGSLKEPCRKRQQYIEEVLGCHFVRIKV